MWSYALSVTDGEDSGAMVNISPGCNSSQTRDEVYETYTFYMDTVVVGTMVYMGIILNMLVFAVLWKERTKSSSFLYLLALSVMDTFYLIHCMLFQVFRSIFPYTGSWEEYGSAWPYIEPYEFPLGMMALTASNWIVASVAIDRFIVVRFPLKARIWCSVRRTKLQLLVIVIVDVVVNSVWFFRQCTYERWDHCTNSTVPVVVPYAIGATETGRIAHTSIFLTLVFAIPIVTMMVVNILLVYTLNKQRKKIHAMTHVKFHSKKLGQSEPDRDNLNQNDSDDLNLSSGTEDNSNLHHSDPNAAKLGKSDQDQNTEKTSLLRISRDKTSSKKNPMMTARQKYERKITMMLIIIILQNLLCLTPVFIDHILFSITTIDKISRGHKFFSVFANMLAALNSSMDFFIYCCFVASMRKRFVRVLCSCRRFSKKYRISSYGTTNHR